MHILGFELQNTSSPTGKRYAAFALTDGTYVIHYGGDGLPGQMRQTRDLRPRDAAQRVTDKYLRKRQEGYDVVRTSLVIAEVPDDTSLEQLREALANTYEAGFYAEPFTPRSTVDQFVALCPDPSTAAPAAPGAPVAQRAPKLRLADGDVPVRPNGEPYLPRDLGGHTDVAALRRLAEADLYCLLAGEPGTGKTALAEAAHPGMIAKQCHGDLTVANLVGTHMPTPDGGWRWEDGPLTRAMREGRVLYLDEINKLPSEVSAVLHSAMDGRRMITLDDRPDAEPVYAVDGFYVLGAYNPETLGGAGLSEAMLSRFTVQVEVTTDHDAARALGVSEDFITIAENLTEKAAQSRATGGRGVWAPQMRELIQAKRVVDAGMGDVFAAGVMVGQCPWPEDLPTVVDVAQHVLGVDVQPLRLGAQV